MRDVFPWGGSCSSSAARAAGGDWDGLATAMPELVMTKLEHRFRGPRHGRHRVHELLGATRAVFAWERRALEAEKAANRDGAAEAEKEGAAAGSEKKHLRAAALEQVPERALRRAARVLGKLLLNASAKVEHNNTRKKK